MCWTTTPSSSASSANDLGGKQLQPEVSEWHQLEKHFVKGSANELFWCNFFPVNSGGSMHTTSLSLFDVLPEAGKASHSSLVLQKKVSGEGEDGKCGFVTRMR